MQFIKSLVFNIFLYSGLILIFILAIPTLILPSKFTLFFGRLSANYIVIILRIILNTKVIFHGLENLKKVDKFFVVSSGAAERHDHDVLLRTMPRDGSVVLKNITLDYGTLVVCGPRSRDLLSKITDYDMSKEAFPWLTSQRISISGNVYVVDK